MTEGYYGKPIVAPHVWKDYVGWYFFTGGLAGASSVLAAAAELAGRPCLARHARNAAMIGLAPSPVLLVADLGRPKRFLAMLRVFKPSSPMSVGSWLLSFYGGAAAGSFVLGAVGKLPRLRCTLTLLAGVSGAGVATYTGVLVADTATPAWHHAHRELPALFAASAAASAGGVVNVLAAIVDDDERIPARLGALGACVEVTVGALMKRRLGELDTYRSAPAAKRFDNLARSLSIAGALTLMVGRRSRRAGLIGGLAVAGGSLCTRLAVLRAGTASALDPRSVLAEQRS